MNRNTSGCHSGAGTNSQARWDVLRILARMIARHLQQTARWYEEDKKQPPIHGKQKPGGPGFDQQGQC